MFMFDLNTLMTSQEDYSTIEYRQPANTFVIRNLSTSRTHFSLKVLYMLLI
jgi:hypothetical protein